MCRDAEVRGLEKFRRIRCGYLEIVIHLGWDQAPFVDLGGLTKMVDVA